MMFDYIIRLLLFAAQQAILTIDVNTGPNDLTGVVEYTLLDKAGQVVPAICDAVKR